MKPDSGDSCNWEPLARGVCQLPACDLLSAGRRTAGDAQSADMERLVAILATIAVGALIAFQPPVNSELGRRTTVLVAAFTSTAISTIVIGIAALALGEFGNVRRVPHIPVVYLTGGLLGAALVSVSLVTVRTLGAGGVVAATVTGQLIVSAVLDRYGVLGLDRIGLTPLRLAGFALLLAGTAMVTAR
jgi:transporter family-2 protein